MRRRTYNHRELVDKEARITSSQTWTIPAGCQSIDVFLVGGGGAGGKWVNWGYTPGGSGSGGGTNTVKNISTTPGESITITIGSGGSSASAKGSATSIVVNDTTYSAVGGNAGLQGKNGNYDSNPYDYAYKLLGASPTHNGTYKNSGLVATWKDSSNRDQLYLLDASKKVLATYLESEYPASYTNGDPYIYRQGVPEFWEDGKPIHASGGAMWSTFRVVSDFTDGAGTMITRQYTGEPQCRQYGGGGYGGGGAGCNYGSASPQYSKGGNGICIIRYKAYE